MSGALHLALFEQPVKELERLKNRLFAGRIPFKSLWATSR
jgi:hypothetical protein